MECPSAPAENWSMQHGNAQGYVSVEFAEVLNLCLLLEISSECERSDVGLEAGWRPHLRQARTVVNEIPRCWPSSRDDH